MSDHGIGASTSIEPASSSRAIINAVRSLLTLATTIGESDVAAVPPMVIPDARFRTMRPSRTTVIVAASFGRASASKAAFARRSAGSGSGATVVVVDVVVVVEVVVVVVDVVVEVLVDEVVVDVVVVGVVVVVVDDEVVVDSKLAADSAAHPAAIRSEPTIRTTGRARTPSR